MLNGAPGPRGAWEDNANGNRSIKQNRVIWSDVGNIG